MIGRMTFLATAGTLALAPAAMAQLPLPLPVDPTTIVDQVTGTAGGLAPAAPAPVQQALDQLLAGGLPGLDPNSIDGLLGSLGLPAAVGGNRAGAPGGSSAAGTVIGATNGVVDGRPPTATVTVLSHLRVVRRTGRMVVRVASTEPSVVALAGTVRPGMRLRKYGKTGTSFRKPVTVKRTLLAFRRAGSLRLSFAMPRSAQKRLGQARDARLSLATYAVDVSRNQATRNVKRHVKR
jgi:hypothetical protein